MSEIVCTVAPKRDVLIDVAAVAVSMDEPCMGLAEVNIMSPGSQGWHRYRTVYVMRGDRVATFMQDLGPSENFAGVQEFRIPGGVADDVTGRFDICHKVGELCDIADYLQAGFCEPPEYTPSPDLLQDALLQHEEVKRCEKSASTFSEAHKIQRS